MAHSFLKKNLLFLAALSALPLVGCASASPAENSLTIPLTSDKYGTFYQIFPYSFADSNGDGIGDLNGITAHLDYLQELGVTRVWLTPIFASPTYHKYDVKDYYTIDPSFGDLSDFQAMIAAGKSHGISFILDMTFNHCSLQNPWFLQAVEDCANENTAADSMADEFAISLDSSQVKNTKASLLSQDGVRVYYECNFDTAMPEFNLASTKTIAKQQAIMAYWLNEGAAGFRFDGVYYYFYGDDPKSLAYCQTLYREAHSLKDDVYLVGEYWNGGTASLNDMAQSQMTFFDFPNSQAGVGGALYSIRTGLAKSFSANVASNEAAFLKKSQGKALPSYFISNHDMDRWGSFASSSDKGLRQAKCAAAATLLTPGTPFMYYGEEIGLKGNGNDPNRRLPMQWLSNKSSDTARCAYPTGAYFAESDQVSWGASEKIKEAGSLTAFYAQVLALRKAHPILASGIYNSLSKADSPVSLLEISLAGQTAYLATNFDSSTATLNVPSGLSLAASLDVGGVSSLSGSLLSLTGYSTVFLQKTSNNA